MIKIRNLSKIYKLGASSLPALADVSFNVSRGEFVTIIGSSGSGKTTLMNILGCLDRPDSGEYLLDGENVLRLNQTKLAKLRNEKIGFIFQSFNLLEKFTSLENVCLPLMYAGMPKKTRLLRAKKALESVGLSHRTYHFPYQLSGGQQQRVAIARAIAGSPSLLLADEPTGNLDSSSGKEILDILLSLNRNGTTIVLITHDPEVAAKGQRTVKISDGKLVDI